MANTHSLNVKIPQWTHRQLEDLKREQGTTKTQLVITAIDHYKREGQGYNGWTNYETWAVSLWLNNEPGTYHQLNTLLENEPDDYDAGNEIKDWVEDMNPLAEQASLFSDLISAALREVNWVEIARDNRPD